MSVLRRLLPNRWRTALVEALGGSALGSFGVSDDPELRGMRSVSATVSTRNLDSKSQDEMLRVAHYLYESNMLAGGVLIDQRVDIAIGGKPLNYSIKIDSTRAPNMSPEEAQKLTTEARRILDKTWNHPTHNLGARAREYVTTFLVQGELLLPIVAVNDVDGRLQLDHIDAAMIKSVEMVGTGTAAASSLAVEAVLVKPPNVGGEARRFRVVRHDAQSDRLMGPPTGPARAESSGAPEEWAFFFRHSRILNASRGRSDLLRPADFLSQVGDFLFSLLDRATSANASLWDVTVKGSNQDAIAKRGAEITKNPPTKALSVIVHNDQEEWKLHVPDLKSSDAAEGYRLFQNAIIGHKGVPESWVGTGSETNRATLGDQNDVTLRQLEALQDAVVAILLQPLMLAYDNLAELQTKFPARSTGAVEFTVNLPPLSEKDSTRAGSALVSVGAALDTAIAAKLVSTETARRAFLATLQHAGIVVDPEDEARRIAKEHDDREDDDAAKANAAARDAIARARAAGNTGPGDQGDDDVDGGDE